MNGSGKKFGKHSIQHIKKTVKNQSETATCEQKTNSKKANFCSNKVFSLYFKIKAKHIHTAKPLALSLHLLLWCNLCKRRQGIKSDQMK